MADTLETTTGALKPESFADGVKVYRVVKAQALAPGERMAVKLWAESAGTLERVVLRWRAFEGKHSRQESLNGSRELAPGEVVEFELHNRFPQAAIVSLWCHVRQRR